MDSRPWAICEVAINVACYVFGSVYSNALRDYVMDGSTTVITINDGLMNSFKLLDDVGGIGSVWTVDVTV